jgi:hypothetical protein
MTELGRQSEASDSRCPAMMCCGRRNPVLISAAGTPVAEKRHGEQRPALTTVGKQDQTGTRLAHAK